MSRLLIIVGEGRIGLSLAADLADAPDFEPAVVGKSTERPTFLDRWPRVAYLTIEEPNLRMADWLSNEREVRADELVVVFCVPDDALPTVCEWWSENSGLEPAAVLHTSGVHSAAVFDSWRNLGVPAAAWHPMVAVATPTDGAFRGVWFGMDGDPAAAGIGRELAGRLGGRAHWVSPLARSHYHTAGVFASNYLVACLKVAVEELGLASDDAGLEALLPLARSALDNLAELGLPEGATGPVVRGDIQTVMSHLQALDRHRAAVYRALGLELLELTGDRLDPVLRAALEDRLSGEPPL